MRHDQARCGCGAIVQLPHAKARAYTARCEECHRRAAGAAPDAGVMRACEFDREWKLAEQNAPEPDSPLREKPLTPSGWPQPVEQTIARVRYVGAAFQVMFWGELRTVQNWLTVRDQRLRDQIERMRPDEIIGGKVRYIAESGEVVALYPAERQRMTKQECVRLASDNEYEYWRRLLDRSDEDDLNMEALLERIMPGESGKSGSVP